MDINFNRSILNGISASELFKLSECVIDSHNEPYTVLLPSTPLVLSLLLLPGEPDQLYQSRQALPPRTEHLVPRQGDTGMIMNYDCTEIQYYCKTSTRDKSSVLRAMLLVPGEERDVAQRWLHLSH